MGSGYNFSQQHGMSHKEVYERCAHHTRGTVVVLLFAVQATSVQKQKVKEVRLYLKRSVEVHQTL